jgi:hypothetical protein
VCTANRVHPVSLQNADLQLRTLYLEEVDVLVYAYQNGEL